MNPKEIAARFAAFTWYTNNRHAPTLTTQAEARRFSQESWESFLPIAQEGLGRLLLRVAKTRSARQRRSTTENQPIKRKLAARI